MPNRQPRRAGAPDKAPGHSHARGDPHGGWRLPSPLTLRVLAVNVLALALLVGGLLFLGRYQERLVQAELEALGIEARIYAGAIGEAAVTASEDETFELAPDLARPLVRRLVETTETRTRLFDTTGTLVADSRVLIGPGGVVQIDELPAPSHDNPLAQFAIDVYDKLAARLSTRDELPVYREAPVQAATQYDEVMRALSGENAAQVWSTADLGLMLTAAVPVQRYKQVMGAVLVSRSGSHIDATIRSVRFDILKVFMVALAVTVLLSYYLASTIARPIRRLAHAADGVRRGHGRHAAIPDFSHRGDEIGDLSGALREMTGALWARMDAIDRFAADVAHEIKNPLTSLRSAVETVRRIKNPEQQRRLMQIIEDDVQRLDRLISDISNASRLDAELSRAEAEPVDLAAMLRMLVDIHNATAPTTPDDGGHGAGDGDGAQPVRLLLDLPAGETGDGDLMVPGLEGRLVQVFQNLIANAVSFSPPGGTVRLSASPDPAEDAVEVRVEDQGPGLPEGKLEAIFDRFYTERPAGEKFGTHSGLGLSISKQIIDAHHGAITAENRPGPEGGVAGAVFTVRLPRE